MAERTAISWADKTFNGWIGCAQKLSRDAIDKIELEALASELGADETIEQFAQLLILEIETRIKHLRNLKSRIEFAVIPREADK
jgi:hypothetical protein